MKKIVTHLSPHLDEIVGIYLIKAFDPAWRDAEMSYKAMNPAGGDVDLEAVDEDPDVIYIGIGHSKYDEHKLSKEEAADKTSAVLVWQDLKARGLAPQDDIQVRAIEKLLQFIIAEDTGSLKSEEHWLADFTIESLWAGFSQANHGDSDKKLEYGLPLVGYMLTYLGNIATAEKELEEKGQEFESLWGPAVAIESNSGAVGLSAYRQGKVLVVGVNPKLGYRRFTGKTGSTVDLTPIYEKLKQIDPEVEWYLHQGKRMLLSGSHSAPNVKISKLTLQQMVDLVKKD